MANKQDVIKTIQQNVMTWSRKTELQEYLRDELSKVDKKTGNCHIDDIVNHAITWAKAESEPRWTKLLFDNIKTNDKDTNVQNNFFLEAATKSNESVDKLIGKSSTKKESSIRDII